MAFAKGFPGVEAVGVEAERAWKLPVGAISPLWAVFGAAAGAGIAYWWMTHWTRAVNLEALGGVKRVAPPTPAAVPVEIIAEPEAVSAPVIEAVVMAEAVTEPLVEAAVEEVAAAADDLTRMVGIGPKLSEALAARGVTRFAQIAAWTPDDLTDIDAALSLKGRAVREAWVAQARRLAADA
jgi:predicted flap endonuclease-1-like 5' DNA nuclease